MSASSPAAVWRVPHLLDIGPGRPGPIPKTRDVSPGDKPAAVDFAVTGRVLGNMKDPEARKAALARMGWRDRPAFYLKQVHGTEIAQATQPVPPPQVPEADGWITDIRGIVLCVYAADCMPIFMWDKAGTAVGVFHAGWRGLELGMPREAVAAFKNLYGIPPGDLQVAIGPHIGPCCYQVGPEMRARFKAGLSDDLRLDMGKEVVAQLGIVGGPAIGIDRSCTSCRNDDWFSFRREKSDGRMMASISLDP